MCTKVQMCAAVRMRSEIVQICALLRIMSEIVHICAVLRIMSEIAQRCATAHRLIGAIVQIRAPVRRYCC